MASKGTKIPAHYEYLFKGAGKYDVVIRTKTREEVDDDATDEQKAGLEDLLERFAHGGPSALPRDKLNGNEGWFPSHKAAGKIRLQAFKPWQLRAYGYIRSVNGTPTFIITGVDCSKKQNKANPSILRAAGNEAVWMEKYFK